MIAKCQNDPNVIGQSVCPVSFLYIQHTYIVDIKLKTQPQTYPHPHILKDVSQRKSMKHVSGYNLGMYLDLPSGNLLHSY